MEVLTTLSENLAGIVEAVGASVVRVEARRRRPGSGIAWSADGTIVTAEHLIERDEEISVGLPDGRVVPATLVGRDSTTDLAVLRAQGASLTPPAWVGPDDLRVGHMMLALGRPGRTMRAALGIINALGDNWRTPRGGQIDRYVQADVGLSPGFSGGPLVDMAGKGRGLNTRGMFQRTTLTIPVPTLRRVVETLLLHGRVRRGYLGIGTQPVPLPAKMRQQLGQDGGLLVHSVAPGSPAEHGGQLQGDIIVTFEGTPIRRPDDLMAILSGDRVGRALSLRIIRGGQLHELNVVVGERE